MRTTGILHPDIYPVWHNKKELQLLSDYQTISTLHAFKCTPYPLRLGSCGEMFAFLDALGAELGTLAGRQSRPLEIGVFALPFDGVVVRTQELALAAHSGCFFARGACFCHKCICTRFCMTNQESGSPTKKKGWQEPTLGKSGGG